MIIPTPYEDELLCSIVSRYMAWNGTTVYKAMGDLMGNKHTKLDVYLPVNLKVFAERANLDIEFIIYKTTLFNFFAVFKTSWIRETALSMMLGDQRNEIGVALETHKRSIAKPEYLRFCPECWEEDIKVSGESYWRRLYQVPGVVICPTHQRILHKSKILNSSPRIDIPSNSNCFPSKPILNLNEWELSLSLEIVKSIQWVFKNYDAIITYGSLSPEIYLSKIIESELILRYRAVDIMSIGSFLKCFQQFYGEKLLSEWGLTIDKEWLYKTTFGFANHPLSHILLIHFLYGGIKNLYRSPDFHAFQFSYHQEKKNWFLNDDWSYLKSEILRKVQSYKNYSLSHKYKNHYEIPDGL